jgi:hypothetical protein
MQVVTIATIVQQNATPVVVYLRQFRPLLKRV